MANFNKFKKAIQDHFYEMSKGDTPVFEVDLDKDKLWELYLSSFPAGTNPIFRERTKHDCSCCRQFVKNIGNAVTILNGELHTIWEVSIDDDTYQVQVVSWYDNENSYTSQMVRTIKYFAEI